MILNIMDDIYIKYQKCVIEQNKILPIQWKFKQHSDYIQILEHTTFNDAIKYLQLIVNEFKIFFINNKNFLINLCILNDSLGDPIKMLFQDFCNCSPSNLRYIYHSLLILTHMKNLNLKTIDIIEIGGGYGGLCFFINKLSVLFDITINNYTIFDLEHVIVLQKTYLKEFNITVNTTTLENTYSINQNSFLISNYSFSEFSSFVQHLYQDRIIPFCNHGFLVWNGELYVYEFTNCEFLLIENERPQTGICNKFIYF